MSASRGRASSGAATPPAASSCAQPHACPQLCINIPGSFRCRQPGGDSCLDVDECLRDLCPGACRNFPGGYECLCPPGSTRDGDGHGCSPGEDIDDCASEPSPCEHQCVNTKGGFECRCHSGYSMVEGRCQPLPPCWKTPCQQLCQESPQGYRCGCHPGYALDPRNSTLCRPYCNATECPALCDDSGDCFCPEGFLLDGDDVCADIDECESDHCPFNCTNTPGGYQCHCPQGHQFLDSDCVPVPPEDVEEELSGDFEPFLPTTAVPSRPPPKDEGLHPGAGTASVPRASCWTATMCARTSTSARATTAPSTAPTRPAATSATVPRATSSSTPTACPSRPRMSRKSSRGISSPSCPPRPCPAGRRPKRRGCTPGCWWASPRVPC
uniref:Thrombomodulin n=1 Tax=Ficedula albicollis TaxID=59894 RepID=A0A803VMN2_FICAL